MDWGTVIKPLLSNHYGVLSKAETINIIKAITRCENDFFDEESNNVRFYIAFAALAADKLSQCKLVCQTQVPQIQEACYVLIRFILNKLQKVNAYELKWLLSALKSLCEAKSNAPNAKASLSTTSSSTSCTSNLAASHLQFDYNAVVATLRNIKYPEASKTIVTGSDKDSPKSEIKRSRSDLSSVILQQLTAPLEAGKVTWAPLSDEFTDCSDIFASNNVAYLQSLNGVDIILNICLKLNSIAGFDSKFQEAVNSTNPKQIYLPLSQAEALIIKKELVHMVTDVSILWQVLSLPILEPLTPQRIVTLSKLALSVLYCGVTASIACSVLSMTSSGGSGSNTASGSSLKSNQATVSATSATTQPSGNTKEQGGTALDDAEEQARFIVDKAIEIYTMIGEFFKNNASSYVYHNHLCYGAWMLVTGILGALGASGSNVTANNANKQQQQPSPSSTSVPTDEQTTKNKSRTPETPTVAPTTGRVNLFKVQQGFGVLNVAIANYCIKLLSELIEHLKVETTFYDAVNFSYYSPSTASTKETLPEAANFDILQQHSPLQRTMRILNTATLHQLFTYLATVSYRKACALKRAHAKDRTECEPISYSDSTTYFNDSLSCSDNSEEDDSESYLGNWFKETLSPDQNEEAGNGGGSGGATAQAQERIGDQQKSNLVGDEPHEYLDLSAKIFSFLELFFANKHTYLHSYVKAGLSEQQMSLLANILKDLDRDAARGEPELGVCVKWQGAMLRFSGAVGRYLHNLISAGLLSESLQSNLLQNLNVSPWSTETNAWPLQVYSSTLSVLVQILLLKPTQEKEAACLWVWHRLINTLVEGVCATSVTSTAADADYEDLNMEHAQLLLFLFHSLNLMQKKSILLLTAGGVIRCAEVCRGISGEMQIRNSQIMRLSRLLLFLEYLMKHLYNAPPELLDQVRWNLFSISTMGNNQKLTDLHNSKTKLTSFYHKNVEDFFRKGTTDFPSNIKPTFYSLTLIDSSSTSNEFKLDGLAWNFILCTPDKLKYPMLVDALIDILQVIDMSSWSVNTHALCAMQYCFSICWKLLLGLPPSTQHVEALMQPVTPTLHSLLWSIRCTMCTAKYLISSSLIKQGMYTQFAENLWNSVCAQVSDMRTSVQQTLLGVRSFVENVQKDQPTLSQIILLDALVAHMEAVAYVNEHNIKPPRVAGNNAVTAEKDLALQSDTNSDSQNTNKNDQQQLEQEQPAGSEEYPTLADLSCELLEELLNAYNAISILVGDKMKQQLSDNVSPALLDLIIPIVGKNNRLTNDVNCWFLKMLTERDREVVTIEWNKCLQLAEFVFDGETYLVEDYTLSVIDAHVQELIHGTSSNGYNQLISLKHTLRSMLQLVFYLLPLAAGNRPSDYSSGKSTPEQQPRLSSGRCGKNYEMLREQLKPLLVATMLDMRMNNLYAAAEGALTGIGDISLLTHEYTLRHLYKLMLALCSEMRQAAKQFDQSEVQSKNSLVFAESMWYAALRSMTQMADSSDGLRALRDFFARKKEGNLVELLLCFEGTTMSLANVREHLCFMEKLFAQSQVEQQDFGLDELRACFADLAHVDESRIKSWLSHVIYGNRVNVGVTSNSMASDKAQASSTPSSNAQTPTNMATVSAAMPSLVTEVMMAEIMDMEIDDEGMAVAVSVPPTINNDDVAGQAEQQPQQQVAAPQTGNNNSNNNMWLTAGGASSFITTINNSEPTSPEQETAAGGNGTTSERNSALLLRLINHIVGDGKSMPGVSMLLFQSLLQLGQSLIAPPHETADFADLLQIMISLADTTQARGHATLFNATIMWLEITKFQILERALTAKSTTTTNTTTTTISNNLGVVPSITLENISALLRYLSDLLQSLGYKGSRNIAPPWDDELLVLPLDADDMCLEDCVEVLGADDDGNAITASTLAGTDDDEESLNNKLCTFSQTQKEFMNQHWYHCHTCNMVNTVGVCSVCARVCHKGHDVSYAKYGNFFCDCGAKEDGSCQALVRRTSTTNIGEVRTHSEYLILGGKKRLSPPPPPPPPPPTSTIAAQTPQNERIALLSKLLEASREQLQNKDQWSQIVRCILDFFDVLLPAISENCALYSIVGCHKRAQMALTRLHTSDKLSFEWTDNLLIPTLGSQEGAFENVRMSYSGDQGQTIKQLLSSGLVRRVALCCLSAPQGKRQHLAVSHEKNKVTILQLSALLKQADAAKRKLTLTQLAAAPIPCTVLSLTANPANEDCLAVCGLKECHILTFASNGATNEHLVLTPQLENGNFIKKALWLPGAQTLLALVTADYVKIYDLAEDAYSPKYYFLVAVGKIRDCTFVYQSGVYYMLLIASSGYIYYQNLDEQSLAKHGDFYVTNTLELNHPQIKDVSGQVDGGGVSIYYSHTLQLLFFSYSIGRSFMAPLVDVNKGVESILLLQTSGPTKAGSASSANKAAPQALCQWTEIAGHPGLICSMFHTSNNPVIFMLNPDRICVQEIKAQSSKSRIMDMVAIRHTVAGLEKTTLILLCEDGSLRIFTAQPETTNFWLSPQVQPVGNQLFAGTGGALLASGHKGLSGVGGKRSKRKTAAMAAAAVSAQQQKALATNGAPVFPIDYFEHCSILPDVEFGGNDLLQIYNKQKLKTRLMSAGMYVVSTKPSGFKLEVINNDANMAIVGIRVLMGTQEVHRAPQNVNILGRIIPTPVRRARWFDIPLTREEILQSDKCLKVGFGKSQDQEHVCMLDSIEVYGKSKELLAWPDDADETNCAPPTAIAATTNACNTNTNSVGNVAQTALVSSVANVRLNNTAFADTNLDRMLSHLLEVLDCSLQLLGGNQIVPTIKTKATRIATTLLLLPTAVQIQMQIRYVIATLFGNRSAYHQFKDYEVLKYVFEELTSMQAQLSDVATLCQIDPEHFYRLILLVRNIASSRASSMTKICAEHNYDIVGLLKTCVEQLYVVTPSMDEPTSIVRRGLCHPELIVQCLMEIMYAFALYDVMQVQRMTKFIIDLLKHESSIISHSAKEALILLLGPRLKRRKVAIVTPPTCSTPTPSVNAVVANDATPTPTEHAENGSLASGVNAGAGVPTVAGPPTEAVARSNSAEYVDAGALDEANQQLMNLDAFMGLQLLGLQQDADEEAIMDIAIALSLQQHDGEALQSLQQGLANLRNSGLPAALEGGNIANAASVSQGGSDDDEVSNVATDGSTLRTSPAEAVGSGGSESGGSGVESIGGQSGRSSTYGDQANTSPPRSAGSSSNMPQELPGSSKSSVTGIATTSIDEAPSTSASAVRKLSEEKLSNTSGVVPKDGDNDELDDIESEDANLAKLHDLRLAILDNIIQNIPTFDNCNGIQAIPIIQVILMLTTDLNGNNERDQKCLTQLITALVQYVETNNTNTATKMKERNAKNEVRLVVLCLFGVLMGKTKSKQTGTTSPPHQFKDNASFVAGTTANILSNNGAITFSMLVMESMLQHWKRVSSEQSYSAANSTLAIVTPQNSNSSGSGGGSSGSAAVPNNNNNNNNNNNSNNSGNTANNVSPTHHQLLKVTRCGAKPDISTLIPHNYLKNYPDIFECYDSLLTETCVRLPYQILRLTMVHAGSFEGYSHFCETMTYTLCEYMMLNLNALLRRQVRKLLMYICGSKEKFRMYRDGHSLNVHFNYVKTLCGLTNTKNIVLSNHNIPILSYDSLVELTEHLRTCQEIAQIRTGNWQKFCLRHEDVIPVLIDIACYQLDDGVLPIILQLLQAALCNNTHAVKQSNAPPQPQSQPPPITPSPANAGNNTNNNASNQNNNNSNKQLRSEREKSEEMADSHDSKFDPAHCSAFVHQIFRYVSDGLLNKFVRIFLLETNITSIRWQAHALIFAIYEHSNERQKEKLISVLWNLWPLVPAYGRRTAQFVDILGYLTLSTRSIADKLPELTQCAIEVLRQQNDLLSKHPNAPIYTTLEQILQVNGYYLESEPCLVCNNPEVPMANIKLPSIKSDSKFTTTNMIVKLVQSHTISKLIVRIADLKRTKMVRTLNIFYNNRTVQAVVELKNRPALWHKARSVTLQSGQTEVKIDFPLPITACNLMIEYADFYETVTGSSENLQCPRCSAAVPAYPGVCANCGENVFQCHKCRAINYDEKDPFLCHSCGFCKYAKFDFSIYGRVCCAVDPIESAEDRAKTVQIIHTSLERADRIYRQLQANKQMLELLVQKVSEHRCQDRLVDDNLGTVHTTSQVNKIIQLLAQKYCVESRTSFEELSKIVQKVKACRSELVTYDRSQQDQHTNKARNINGRDNCSINRCYGCALASTEQCLKLLRAMASNYECRVVLYAQGLVGELALNNLRRGTPQIQDEVINLLVLLTKSNKDACENILGLISERVKTVLLDVIPLPNLDAAIHHEMVLLEVLIAQDDFCWEQKVKVVFELFLLTCLSPRGPTISVLQPCLRILQAVIGPVVPTSKMNRDLTAAQLATIGTVDGLTVDHEKWLANDPLHNYDTWKARMPSTLPNKAASPPRTKGSASATALPGSEQEDLTMVYVYRRLAEINGMDSNGEKLCESELETLRRQLVRESYLSEKYARRWRQNVLDKHYHRLPLDLTANWLQTVMFNTNSRFARQLACSLVTSLSRTHECKRELLNLLTIFLKHVGEVGEASAEFLTLYRAMAADTPWRQYLALSGVLLKISQLLTAEIVKIHHLEETTLSSDMSQGYALRQFVELLSLFLECPNIRQTYKTRLLGPVLEGYLSLRKLVVQRTRLIDDAQEKLLEMLEEMTSGTEEETRAFMEILIDTVEKTRIDDIKTPVFIFERLYSIIHPEEYDETEFYMTLEKDPQQEDFLQGRMLGNPYGSTELGLGPLMRDVKNKICTDCELIALLEDDNGMELLVNNKIISLDLPVKDVYKKVWLAEGGDRDAMRIVYRMRGLLGDATEEFIETLNNKSQEEVDTEQLYRLANVLADCNGLKVMLDRIGNLTSISRTRELIQVLLKLFLICVKVRRCQAVLCQPELGAINTLLKVLQMCLQETDSIQSAVTEQLLEIMETILSKAASDTLDSFLQFSLTFGGPEYVSALISCTDHSNVRHNPSVLRHLIRVLAALVYGNEVKMALLCAHFQHILDFDRFDSEHSAEEEFKLELFCVLTNQIEHNCIGGTLKDYIVGLGIVERAIEYIVRHAPCVKPTLLRTDSDELKEFISRNSLKYILRFLTGLAHKHEATQLAISKVIIPIIHRLEQVSSDEHVGSLAENLLEALCTDSGTAQRVQEVRDFTRAEKKRLAMATREKQLDALGMRSNEKGQVTAKGSILQKIEKLRDETGLTCFICREGYACQPAKVLGIYTFTKRCNVEEYELKARKTMGYATVTHFNVVHVDCHTSAIRLARGRDEWDRASLQNANTRCNGLLPLWGPDVTDAAFSGCMTRHSSYMQESTSRCDINFPSSIHDLKLLLMRFAWERSFHDDAGGGGPQSNMHFVPYLLFYAVYLLLSSRSAARDSKTLMNYLTASVTEKWLECAHEVEGPLYMLTISLALHSHETWQKHKLAHLKHLIAIAQARYVSPSVQCKALMSANDRQAKDYNVYKPYLMMWSLVDLIYGTLFKSVVNPKEEDWSISLFDYIRKNDETMLKSTDNILQTFTEEFLPCTSFAEFCDVAGLLHLIENPDSFIDDLLGSLPSAAPATSASTTTTTTTGSGSSS